MIQLAEHLADRPIVAVLRASDANRFVDAAQAIADAGFLAVEFTLTSQGVFDALRKARDRLPSTVLIGAGTLRTLAQVERAIDAGASFLVSQLTSFPLIEAAHQRAIPFLPGALTPNEIAEAWAYEVQAVKVSPIGPLGGTAYLRELVGPLPDVPLFPTGGVRIEEADDYLAAGAALVGISRDLTRDALVDGDIDALAQRAAFAVRRVVAAQNASRGVRG